jgi:ABC-type nitrate/sulfonate/bicarbonate transport system substrate-binding protein
VNRELSRATQWAGQHQEETACLYAEASGVDLEAQRKTVQRTHFSFSAITDDAVSRQQETADRYFRLGLLPAPIKVREAVWKEAPGI